MRGQLTAPVPPTRSLGDYVDIAKRHRFVLIGSVIIGLASGGMYIGLAPREYQSQAQVLVAPTGAEVDITGSRSKSEINLDTEAQLVTSTAVVELAAETLGIDNGDDELSASVNVSVPPNTSILTISFSADSPAKARDGSRSFANAYLSMRADTAQTRLTDKIAIVDGELAGLKTEREEITSALSSLDESEFAYVTKQDERSKVDGEITEWNSIRNQLEQAQKSLDVGRIISKPSLPASPISPQPLVGVAGGIILGLLLGITTAAIRQRFASRVWHPWDVSHRCNIEVIAAIPRTLDTPLNDVFSGFSPGGRIFGRLRNEIVAALGMGSRHTIVVAGVATGAASTVCAANLATALARTGSQTLAVAANPGGNTTIPGLLDTPAIPGLSDVLADRIELDDVTHRAPRHPKLTVIGAGGCGNATGTPSGTIAEITRQLSRRATYIVIDATPMSATAEAQLLATHADAVILAVEVGKDNVTDVAEAVHAMRRIDAPLLGAVVIPRLSSHSTEGISLRDYAHSDTSPDERPSKNTTNKRRTSPPRPHRSSTAESEPDERPTDMIPRITDTDPTPEPVSVGEPGHNEH